MMEDMRFRSCKWKCNSKASDAGQWKCRNLQKKVASNDQSLVTHSGFSRKQSFVLSPVAHLDSGILMFRQLSGSFHKSGVLFLRAFSLGIQFFGVQICHEKVASHANVFVLQTTLNKSFILYIGFI